MIGFYKSRCSNNYNNGTIQLCRIIPLMDAIEFRGGKERKRIREDQLCPVEGDGRSA